MTRSIITSKSLYGLFLRYIQYRFTCISTFSLFLITFYYLFNSFFCFDFSIAFIYESKCLSPMYSRYLI